MTSPIVAGAIKTKPYILVAEDELGLQMLAKKALNLFFDIVIVGNGQMAVDTWKEASLSERPFDAILMDIQMPKKDGTVATQEIRLMDTKIPIIAYTTLVERGLYLPFPLSEQDLVKAKLDPETLKKVKEMAECHFTAVLGKPILALALRQRLRKTLGISKNEGETSSEPVSPAAFISLQRKTCLSVPLADMEKGSSFSMPPLSSSSMTAEQRKAKRLALLGSLQRPKPAQPPPATPDLLEMPFQSLSIGKEKEEADSAE